MADGTASMQNVDVEYQEDEVRLAAHEIGGSGADVIRELMEGVDKSEVICRDREGKAIAWRMFDGGVG
jgi:hypothetical protein